MHLCYRDLLNKFETVSWGQACMDHYRDLIYSDVFTMGFYTKLILIKPQGISEATRELVVAILVTAMDKSLGFRL